MNIDNWTFPSLVRAVKHFKRTQVPGYNQDEDYELAAELEADHHEQMAANGLLRASETV